jgi:hypothetical protein
MSAKKKHKRRSVGCTDKNNAKPKAQSANLRPRWQPGQSGNPSGRPRQLLSIAIRELLREDCPADKLGRTWAEVIALTMAKRALKGNVEAAKFLGDRAEGKPPQSIALSGDLDVRETTEDLRETLKVFTAKVRSRLQVVEGNSGQKPHIYLPASA